MDNRTVLVTIASTTKSTHEHVMKGDPSSNHRVLANSAKMDTGKRTKTLTRMSVKRTIVPSLFLLIVVMCVKGGVS